jgi:hypothetical protein
VFHAKAQSRKEFYSLTVSQFEIDWNAVDADFTDKNEFYIISLFQSPSHRGPQSVFRSLALSLPPSPNRQINKSPNHQISQSPNHPVSKSTNQQMIPSHRQRRCKEQRAGNLVGLFFYQDFTPPGYSPEVPYPIQGTTSR